MKTIIYTAAIAVFAWGCNPGPKEHADHHEGEEHHEHDHEHGHDHDHEHGDEHAHGEEAELPETGNFGAEVNPEGAIQMAEFLTMMEGKDSAEVTIKGNISKVCQKKGCWMDMETADGQTMKVTFKDYGFFVPKNCGGKEAIMTGKAKMETIDVATLQHYAEDAGKSQDEIAAITEPETQLTFEATGVIIQ